MIRLQLEYIWCFSFKPTMPADSYFPLCPQIFLAALSFAYFSKALSGSYMKSTITQLERRFDIPSYLIGVIDGSFEIGECTFPMRPSQWYFPLQHTAVSDQGPLTENHGWQVDFFVMSRMPNDMKREIVFNLSHDFPTVCLSMYQRTCIGWPSTLIFLKGDLGKCTSLKHFH